MNFSSDALQQFAMGDIPELLGSNRHTSTVKLQKQKLSQNVTTKLRKIQHEGISVTKPSRLTIDDLLDAYTNPNSRKFSVGYNVSTISFDKTPLESLSGRKSNFVKESQKSVNVCNLSPIVNNPVEKAVSKPLNQPSQSKKPDELRTYHELMDKFSLHNFIIWKGKCLEDTPEYVSFQRSFAASWGRIHALIRLMERMIEGWSGTSKLVQNRLASAGHDNDNIPSLLIVNGPMLASLAMTENLNINEDVLIDCFVNRDVALIYKHHLNSERSPMTLNSFDENDSLNTSKWLQAADSSASLIQSNYRRHVSRMKFLDFKKKSHYARVIQGLWRTRSAVQERFKKLQSVRIDEDEKFAWLQQTLLPAMWSHFSSSSSSGSDIRSKVILNIPSLSIEEAILRLNIANSGYSNTTNIPSMRLSESTNSCLRDFMSHSSTFPVSVANCSIISISHSNQHETISRHKQSLINGQEEDDADADNGPRLTRTLVPECCPSLASVGDDAHARRLIPTHISLSKLLYYSPTCLQRLRGATGGSMFPRQSSYLKYHRQYDVMMYKKEWRDFYFNLRTGVTPAVIIPGERVGRTEISLAVMLGIPILGHDGYAITTTNMTLPMTAHDDNDDVDYRASSSSYLDNKGVILSPLCYHDRMRFVFAEAGVAQPPGAGGKKEGDMLRRMTSSSSNDAIRRSTHLKPTERLCSEDEILVSLSRLIVSNMDIPRWVIRLSCSTTSSYSISPWNLSSDSSSCVPLSAVLDVKDLSCINELRSQFKSVMAFYATSSVDVSSQVENWFRPEVQVGVRKLVLEELEPNLISVLKWGPISESDEKSKKSDEENAYALGERKKVLWSSFLSYVSFYGAIIEAEPSNILGYPSCHYFVHPSINNTADRIVHLSSNYLAMNFLKNSITEAAYVWTSDDKAEDDDKRRDTIGLRAAEKAGEVIMNHLCEEYGIVGFVSLRFVYYLQVSNTTDLPSAATYHPRIWTLRYDLGWTTDSCAHLLVGHAKKLADMGEFPLQQQRVNEWVMLPYLTQSLPISCTPALMDVEDNKRRKKKLAGNVNDHGLEHLFSACRSKGVAFDTTLQVGTILVPNSTSSSGIIDSIVTLCSGNANNRSNQDCSISSICESAVSFLSIFQFQSVSRHRQQNEDDHKPQKTVARLIVKNVEKHFKNMGHEFRVARPKSGDRSRISEKEEESKVDKMLEATMKQTKRLESARNFANSLR